MSLIANGGRIPPRWAARQGSNTVLPIHIHDSYRECLNIALINNMPDAALEDTEIQFFELLQSAASNIPVHVKLYSLSGIPRAGAAQQHVAEYYADSDVLLNSSIDGVIMTGTEPRQSNLRNEPYWKSLARVLDWAQENTYSTVLSCLAAHASVLHCDGIGRHRLDDKQFGLFDFIKTCEHPLTDGTETLVSFPHSRWNALDGDELTAAGYAVLTHSVEVGVDTFVKKSKRSLFVHFQGHPEYAADTLFREYRRDIRRFLRHERETYPTMPKGYFGDDSARLLCEFRQAAISDRCEGLMSAFPGEVLSQSLHNGWSSSATTIYRNWLRYLHQKKMEAGDCRTFVVMGSAAETSVATPRAR